MAIPEHIHPSAAFEAIYHLSVLRFGAATAGLTGRVISVLFNSNKSFGRVEDDERGRHTLCNRVSIEWRRWFHVARDLKCFCSEEIVDR